MGGQREGEEGWIQPQREVRQGCPQVPLQLVQRWMRLPHVQFKQARKACKEATTQGVTQRVSPYNSTQMTLQFLWKAWWRKQRTYPHFWGLFANFSSL